MRAHFPCRRESVGAEGGELYSAARAEGSTLSPRLECLICKNSALSVDLGAGSKSFVLVPKVVGENTHYVQVHFFTGGKEVIVCGVPESRKAWTLSGSFCTRCCAYFQLSENRGDNQIKGRAIESCVLLRASSVCCCGFDQQQQITLVRSQSECIIKTSTAQDTFGGTGIPSRGLVV